MSVLILPWPPRELSPNARVHWAKKAPAVAAYRHQCALLARMQDWDAVPDDGPIAVHLRFRAPDRRSRDLDNMLASFKAGLDGIADALRVNDQRFSLWLERGEPHRGGVVEVWLGGQD